MMKKLLITALCATVVVFSSCKGQNHELVDNLEPKAFAQGITQTDVTVLDVRTPDEYQAQHLQNAINIDYKASNFEAEVAKLDKNKPVYVYCLSGGRSGKAQQKLSELGFKEVHNMTGGIMKWNAEGLSKPSNTEGMTMADFQKLIQSDKKVLIDVYAEWCGPCKKMAPYLEKMKNEMKGQLTIIKIDADKNQQLAQELKIEGLPTLLYYNNGKQVWNNLGYITETELKKKL